VALGNIEITNLCLPPYNMQSTMAADYLGEWKPLTGDKRPYFMHYAGSAFRGPADQSLVL
jgi:hypothetical protein